MSLDLTKAKGLAALPARKRPVLLVADRKTLAEMTSRAEIHPWVSGLLGFYEQKSWWNPQSYIIAPVVDAGKELYVGKSAAVRDSNTSEDQLVARLGAALKFTVPLIWLDPSNADDVFAFDHLKPVQNGKYYVLHPVRENHYVLASDYPQRVLSETHATFLKLAAALGAKSVKLTSVTTTELASGGKLKLPVEEINGVLGIKASVDRSGGVTYSYEKAFSKQLTAPYVPEELKRWVDTDTNLETMALLRLRNGIARDEVSISTANKLGFDAELLAKVGDKEVTAGALYQAALTSTWHFMIEYHPA